MIEPDYSDIPALTESQLSLMVPIMREGPIVLTAIEAARVSLSRAMKALGVEPQADLRIPSEDPIQMVGYWLQKAKEVAEWEAKYFGAKK